MIISVIKEIKMHEYRVGLVPSHVQELTEQGHTVYVETDAGVGSGFSNEAYQEAGAQIVDASRAWAQADMVVKVKEPLPSEYAFFRKGLIIYTYFHLASNQELAEALVQHNVIAIAYETIELEDGSLPLLAPMSEVAGRMAVQVGAQFLEKHAGGKGILLSGIPGVKRGKIVILGGGVVGINAAKIAIGMGAQVTILTRSIATLRYLETLFPQGVDLLTATKANIQAELVDADLLVGGILITGAAAPKIVTEAMVKSMQPGSVIVDVSIDQGGCIETIDHSTTHDDPVYIKHGVIHYAVANMPGAVARTSTLGLTNATSKYAYLLANLGYEKAIATYPELKKGVNVAQGEITCAAVIEAFKDTKK